jgi:hypothetical protein
MPSEVLKPYKMMWCTLLFTDDPTSETKVVLSIAKPDMTHSLTLASIADVQNEDELPSTSNKENEAEHLIPTSDFQVLCLNLKLVTHSSSNSAVSLISQLEKSSIANLLDKCIGASIGHIDKLLEDIIAENKSNQQMIKVYLANTHAPSESLLNNGVSTFPSSMPGLNHDSLKTTALFAQQEEIDVIVFIVSAKNHTHTLC